MVLSFVDRDMIMRYFGGGIGHLGNSTQHQVNSKPPDTEPEELEEDMDISDDGDNNVSGPGEVPEDIMNYVENSDDEQGSGSDSSQSVSDEDSDEGSGEDSDEDSDEGTIIDPAGEDSDDDGYGSF